MSSGNDVSGWPLPCGHRVLDEGQVHYCDYISLAALKASSLPHAHSARRRGLAHHDEHQFVAVHQVFEILFQLHLHELRRLIALLDEDALDEAVHLLMRINHLMRNVYPHLLGQLRTMRKEDFLKFRGMLAPASGFESEGYRLVEILSGVRLEASYGVPFREGQHFEFKDLLNRPPGEGERDPKVRLWTAELEKASHERNLARAAREVFGRREVIDLRACLEDATHPLAPFIRELHAYDEGFQEFRREHKRLAAHAIGNGYGTGQTDGVPYLHSVAETVLLFPELRES